MLHCGSAGTPYSKFLKTAQSTTLPCRQLDGYTPTPAQIITSVAFMMASRVRITAIGADC